MRTMEAQKFFTHETAIVDAGADIGAGTKIWHFGHVCGGARIGKECNLGQNVYVSGKSSMGDFCKVQNNVSVYDGVQIGDKVFIGPSAVFTNDRLPRAVPFGGHWAVTETFVREGVAIGANATILCGITLGEYSMIGAGSTVTHDVKPYALMVGNAARQIGWVSAAGFKLDLPLTSAVRVEGMCAESAERYALEGAVLTKL